MSPRTRPKRSGSIAALVGIVYSTSIVLSGCSSSQTQATPADSPSAILSVAPLTQWASDVCRTRDQLEAQVISGIVSLDIDPGAGLDQIPELRNQAEAQLGALQEGVDQLLVVMRSVPRESPKARSQVMEVERRVSSAQSAGREALTQLRRAADEDNPLVAGLATMNAVSAAQDAIREVRETLSLLSDIREDARGPLSRAFEEAPTCQ